MNYKTFTEKTKYEIYHKSYSDTVTAMINYAKANGYTIVEDDVWTQISTGPGKPKDGKTVKHHLGLEKNGKPQKKMLHSQVYNRGSQSNPYELNMYIS